MAATVVHLSLLNVCVRRCRVRRGRKDCTFVLVCDRNLTLMSCRITLQWRWRLCVYRRRLSSLNVRNGVVLDVDAQEGARSLRVRSYWCVVEFERVFEYEGVIGVRCSMRS